MVAATMIISQPSFSYRLVYFNVRGAAELCRLTLVVSGFDWEDIRYPMAVGQHGFSYGPEFRRDATTGAFAGNFHRLPILQVLDNANNNNKRVALVNLGQSHTIARFVARQHPTLGGGDSALQQAKVDSIHECCRDITSAWYQAKRRKDGKREWWETPRPVVSDSSTTTEQPPPTTLQGWCGLLEDAIASYHTVPSSSSSSSSPWCLGGEHPTLADLAIYHLLATPSSPISGSTVSFFDGFSNKEQIHSAYASFPRISSVVQACSELPSIRDWEQRRPDTFT